MANARKAAAPKKGSTADKEKKVAQVQKKLDPLARQIDARYEQAAKADQKADDHRLAAALHLEEAKRLCDDGGIKFKEWVEANVKWSFDYANRLVKIAQADDPALALADMRAGTAARNKKHRETKKAQQSAPKSAPAEGDSSREPDEATLETYLESLDDQESVRIAESLAGNAGFKLVTEAEAQKLKSHDTKGSKLDNAKFAFDDLGVDDQVRLMAYIAEKTGAEITLMGQPIADAVAALKPAKGRKKS